MVDSYNASASLDLPSLLFYKNTTHTCTSSAGFHHWSLFSGKPAQSYHSEKGMEKMISLVACRSCSAGPGSRQGFESSGFYRSYLAGLANGDSLTCSCCSCGS